METVGVIVPQVFLELIVRILIALLELMGIHAKMEYQLV